MAISVRGAHDVTALLRDWAQGSNEALDQLVPLVYAELRRRAAGYLRHERPGQTLQPTALIHETYLRLIKQNRMAWVNRAQFFGVAAQLMRRVLVDRARARRVAKRSGRWARVTLAEGVWRQAPLDVRVLDIDAALTELAGFDPRKSQIAELLCFGGLTLAEAGDVIGVSTATVERDWRVARAWLLARLRGAR